MVFSKRNRSFRLPPSGILGFWGVCAARQLASRGVLSAPREGSNPRYVGPNRGCPANSRSRRSFENRQDHACVLAALSNDNAACPQFAGSPRFIGNPEVAEIGTIRGMGIMAKAVLGIIGGSGITTCRG